MTVSPSRALITTASALLMLAAPGLSRAAVMFEKQILPILEKSCLDCHRAPHVENGKKKEPKGDVRLDAAWAMLRGNKEGPIVVPKAVAKSRLVEVLLLPSDDDKHMPPKGDPLSEEQIALIKTWIIDGANFGGWEGNQEGRPPEEKPTEAQARQREHDLFYKKLEEGAKPVAEATLKELLTSAGVQASPISTTSPLLRVDYLTGVSKCTDEKVAALSKIADNVAHLDLGRTQITDASLATVAKLPRLARLDLRQTKVTDKGLEALSGLKHLQMVNLYGTEITDAGLQTLAKLKTLRQVVLWQSKATDAGAKKLQAAVPGLVVVLK